MATIVPERLLADLRHLRTFGAQGTGVVRPSLSPVDMAARAWLVDALGDAVEAANDDADARRAGR